MSKPALARADIRRLLKLLAAELAQQDIQGELYLVGGAVMCLALNARESTQGVDAFFKPSAQIRQAAARVAAATGAPGNWLNDAVKGFLDARGRFDEYLDLPHLKVYTAHPHYLLAMKCAAMRLGAEFHDIDDVRYLLRHLNISTPRQALEIVTRYFDESRLLPKTRLILEELLASE